MRTTVNIDEDVLLAVKELAKKQGVSMGRVLSNLTRQALTTREDGEIRNGVPLFPRRPDGRLVTLEIVNQLRDELS